MKIVEEKAKTVPKISMRPFSLDSDPLDALLEISDIERDLGITLSSAAL